MIEVQQIAIAKPLMVGAGATLCTIFIHSLALGATVHLFRRETRLGRAGMHAHVGKQVDQDAPQFFGVAVHDDFGPCRVKGEEMTRLEHACVIDLAADQVDKIE